MFTGIVKAESKVTEARKNQQGMFLEVIKPRNWRVKAGDSILVNGVCSTVKKNNKSLVFEYMPETLEKSWLGSLAKNDVVNLEQSMLASDRLDGHIVQGHVDDVGKIKSIVKQGNSFEFKIEYPKNWAALVAPKGSVAVDGISLTVVNTGKNFFTVKIIPYTLENTNLKFKKPGDSVNLEFDVLAKYIKNILKTYRK